jgi:hypothetical protein
MLTSLFGLCSCHQLSFSLENLLAFSAASKDMKIDNEENYKNLTEKVKIHQLKL